jgi:hypothetical protein
MCSFSERAVFTRRTETQPLKLKYIIKLRTFTAYLSAQFDVFLTVHRSIDLLQLPT